MKIIKKLCYLFVIVFLFFLYFIFLEVCYFKIKTNCEVDVNDIYLDTLICSDEVIVDGGMFNHIILGDEIIVSYMKIIYEYPHICYTDQHFIEVYNYKKQESITFALSDFIKLNKYQLNDDFYLVPKNYMDKYMNNCKIN